MSMLEMIAPGLCESCGKLPATTTVRVGDVEPFSVCPGCVPVAA